ncbi:MAG: N-methyl-L-tryptophan oxidase [Anaerolineae bacterium]|nr:N-methyl-L-tryptophan oxidase [Anaerolineae bacterium]
MYDVIVIGAGAVGSATAYAAARSGARVLLLEQFEIDHGRGSSHGASRIIRYAYDHPIYVAMARDSFPAWADLESESGERLYIRTGGIDFALPDEPLFMGMRRTLKATGVPHEIVSAADAMRRFPQFHLDDAFQVIIQEDAGVLRASAAVRTFVRLAQAHGATVRDRLPVTSIIVHRDAVTIAAGAETFNGARLVIAAGAWLNTWTTPLGVTLPLAPVAAQENYFTPVSDSDYAPERFPVWIGHLQNEYGHILYGLPSVDGSGNKVGVHGGKPIDPHAPDRHPDQEVIAAMTRFSERFFPTASQHKSSRVCIYTNTPDEHFVIDTHPEHRHVVIASCCSGHGFKFSPVLGQTIAHLALTGEALRDLSLFTLARFSAEAE